MAAKFPEAEGVEGSECTSTESQTRDKILKSIVESLTKSREGESWGLIVEAAEDYQKTSFKLRDAALPEHVWFTQEEKNVFTVMGEALYSKSSSLQQLSPVVGSGSQTQSTVDTKQILSALESLQKGDKTAKAIESNLKECLSLPPPSRDVQAERSENLLGAPASVGNAMSLRTFLNMPDDEYEAALEAASKQVGTLLVRQYLVPGFDYLNITIDKIEIKNAGDYIDPFFTVSLKSLTAENLEEPQDTPTLMDKSSSAIHFGVTIQLHRPMQEIPGGSAIFLEFKHHKPKKSIISTKCFSFMEMDEIKPGRCYLEIYKKPTDFRRKKLSLLSSKALYLHLFLSIDRA